MAEVATMATPVAPATTTVTTTTELIPNGMWSSPAVITEGSLVILYENHASLTYCYAKRGEVFYNRHGDFLHNDMIGRRFGDKIVSQPKNGHTRGGYMVLLAPTPELWSRALRHRTQIVYSLDASAIQFSAALRSGHRVVESGTGSGALTTSFARTVAPHGHVFTFEFNPHRAHVAREEFQRNGLSDVITVDCRDAYGDGFPDELAGTIDLVFLDLPCPWKAIDHATKMLKQGGHFASYSPCIEQVSKTCDALREAGYEKIRTIETRLVPFSSRNVELPTPDFGFGSSGVSSQASASASATLSASMTKTETIDSAESTAESNSNDNDDSAEDGATTTTTTTTTTTETTTTETTATLSLKKRRLNAKFSGDTLVARKDLEIRGHTAFLTFASKFFD